MTQKRTIFINQRNVFNENSSERNQMPNNKVITAKYTLFNFVPKNLFEQFRRIANFYFLCISVIQVAHISPVSPITSLVPLIFVITTTAIKQGYEDILRHKSDRLVNKRKIPVLIGEELINLKSEQIRVGDIIQVGINEEIPCDIVVISSSSSDGKCSITTANLDGETNLKVKYALPNTQVHQTLFELSKIKGSIICEQPNADLYEFDGVMILKNETVSHALSSHNLLLRGSRIKNTKCIFGVAVYTGSETKMALNSLLTSNKFSSVERTVNKYLIIYFHILFLFSTLCSLISLLNNDKVENIIPWYLLDLHNYYSESNFSKIISTFLGFFMIFNYLIPISLYVSLEMVKFFGSKSLVKDPDLINKSTLEKPICKSSDLNEELGQVEYLFSDKTGTLTENIMKFKACSIDGVMYEESNQTLCLKNAEGLKPAEFNSTIEEFFTALCICNLVEVCVKKIDESEIFEYRSDSPDEKALVEASYLFGIKLISSSDFFCTIKINSTVKTFKKLQTFEFDANRKCMSVIAQDEQGNIFLVSKGADITMFAKVEKGKIEKSTLDVEKFSRIGLRTLVIATKSLSKNEYEKIKSNLNAIQMAENKKELFYNIQNTTEQGLTLLGATAVEDKLQEGVPETIRDLKKAGIKIWMLTGDKLETSVSVAHACFLIEPEMKLLMFSQQTTSEACHQCIQNFNKIICSPSDPSESKYALIIDGKSLHNAMKFHKDIFQNLCERSEVVICCRMSPLQKAEVIHMIKTSRHKPVTAAIGDGANDVSMIQQAHVGFGLMGKEGRQAAYSSDFAFSRFKHIRKILLVHGHLYYSRVATLIHYFFYKNVAFVTPQICYAFYSCFSTQSLYHGMLLMWYNMIFTAAPIFIYGLSEQYIPDKVLEEHPELYQTIRKNAQMSFGNFCKWFCFGIYHGTVAFFGFKLAWEGPSLPPTLPIASTFSFGATIYHSIVHIVNLRLLIISQNWHPCYLIILLLSLLSLYFFGYVFSKSRWQIIDGNLHGTYSDILENVAFWLNFIIVWLIAILPDLLWQIFKNSLPCLSLRFKLKTTGYKI